MEGLDDDELEDEADEEVEKILYDLTDGKLGQAGTVGAELPVSGAISVTPEAGTLMIRAGNRLERRQKRISTPKPRCRGCRKSCTISSRAELSHLGPTTTAGLTSPPYTCVDIVQAVVYFTSLDHIRDHNDDTSIKAQYSTSTPFPSITRVPPSASTLTSSLPTTHQTTLHSSMASPAGPDPPACPPTQAYSPSLY